MHAVSTLSWGFRLTHDETELWIATVTQHLAADDDDDDDEEESLHEFLDNTLWANDTFFDYKFQNTGREPKMLAVYYTPGIGTLELSGRDGDCDPLGLGDNDWELRRNALCLGKQEEFERLKRALLLEEAGLQVNEQWLLMLEVD